MTLSAVAVGTVLIPKTTTQIMSKRERFGKIDDLISVFMGEQMTLILSQ